MVDAEQEVSLLCLEAVTGHFGGDAAIEAGVKGLTENLPNECLIAMGNQTEGREDDGDVGVGDGVVKFSVRWTGREAGKVS